MRSSPLTASYARWTHPCWEVRVRTDAAKPGNLPMYLWGSAGITQNLEFATPLLLHVHNDLFGDPVTVGTQVAQGAKTTLGTLQPGEALSIPIQGISGVFATCETESAVWCLVKSATDA